MKLRGIKSAMKIGGWMLIFSQLHPFDTKKVVIFLVGGTLLVIGFSEDCQ